MSVCSWLSLYAGILAASAAGMRERPEWVAA